MELPQDQIIAHVSTFVNILAMTRDMKFLNWSSGTVAKAFGWAEVVAKYGELTADELSFMDSSIIECISFLTDRCLEVVREPYELILKAVLTSPLLSWCRNAVEVIKETLERFKDVHTIDRVVYASIPILLDSVIKRLNEKKLEVLSSQKDTVKESLAIELMCALSSSIEVGVDGTATFNDDIISKISIKVRGNLLFGEIFARGLLLSPGQIMCGQVVVDQNIDPTKVIQVVSHPMMWNILETYADQNARSFADSFDKLTLSNLLRRSKLLRKSLIAETSQQTDSS